jgi:hypothetical protein
MSTTRGVPADKIVYKAIQLSGIALALILLLICACANIMMRPAVHACLSHQPCNIEYFCAYFGTYILYPIAAFFIYCTVRRIPHLTVSREGVTLTLAFQKITTAWETLDEFRLIGSGKTARIQATETVTSPKTGLVVRKRFSIDPNTFGNPRGLLATLNDNRQRYGGQPSISSGFSALDEQALPAVPPQKKPALGTAMSSLLMLLSNFLVLFSANVLCNIVKAFVESIRATPVSVLSFLVMLYCIFGLQCGRFIGRGLRRPNFFGATLGTILFIGLLFWDIFSGPYLSPIKLLTFAIDMAVPLNIAIGFAWSRPKNIKRNVRIQPQL